MGKKKGKAPAAAARAAADDSEGPLWVERRRLEEDWGRSAARVKQGLEAWRGALRRLLR
jgi:hypothetical protein